MPDSEKTTEKSLTIWIEGSLDPGYQGSVLSEYRVSLSSEMTERIVNKNFISIEISKYL